MVVSKFKKLIEGWYKIAKSLHMNCITINHELYNSKPWNLYHPVRDEQGHLHDSYVLAFQWKVVIHEFGKYSNRTAMKHTSSSWTRVKVHSEGRITRREKVACPKCLTHCAGWIVSQRWLLSKNNLTLQATSALLLFTVHGHRLQDVQEFGSASSF